MLETSSYTSQQRPATWLFRKIYNGSPNYLGGNCYTGQLVLEGYKQEEAIGTTLYNAYIGGDLKLFPTNVWSEINSTEYIYLRSDDEQRTLMSGQILMHTFFNVSFTLPNLNSALYLIVTLSSLLLLLIDFSRDYCSLAYRYVTSL